jgi:AraC-like DNA-binding protein
MSTASASAPHEPAESGARIREHLYYPTHLGNVFATCGMTVRVHLPFHGMLVVSLSEDPIEIQIGSVQIRHHAMALWPKDVWFKAPRTPFLTLSVNPLHRDFRTFTRLPEPGVMPLDREVFASFDRLMRRAVEGTLSLQQATQLFGELTRTTRELLPAQHRLDERSRGLTTLLLRNPRASITELAAHLKLSYHRTSHVFADAVGIPFRTYQLWQKLYLTQSPLRQRASLTEVAHAAGFVDSAHYSRAFHTAYGRCPTEMFRTRKIKVFVPDGFSELQLRQ